MGMPSCSMSQSWCSADYSVSHTLLNNNRTARVTVSLHLYRNDGGRSWNYEASNNFAINIGGSVYYHTVQEISGTGGVTISSSRDISLDNSGKANVAVSVSGSLSGTTFQITGNNSTTYSVTNGSPATWTVSFNANGGSGAPSAQTKTYGSILTLSSTVPTRSGYIFKGWGTSSTATTASYQPGGSYGNDASITLYAIWQLADKIKFNITASDITIPSTSAGNANASTVKLPFSVISTSNNYTSNFYYKVCYVDNSDGTVADLNANSLNTTYGPMTAKQIADGGGDDYCFNIPISASLLYKSIQNCKSETKVKFFIAICLIDNSFSAELTHTQVVECNLLNFNFLTMDVISCYRNSSNGVDLSLTVKFPASYTAMTTSRVKLPTAKMDGSTAVTLTRGTVTIGSTKLVTYAITMSSSNVNSNSHGFTFEITDGISTAKGYARVGPVGGEDIYIFSDNHVEAIEFIEGDFTGFEKGGKCHAASEFVETDEGVFVGGQFLCKELIEV